MAKLLAIGARVTSWLVHCDDHGLHGYRRAHGHAQVRGPTADRHPVVHLPDFPADRAASASRRLPEHHWQNGQAGVSAAP